MVVGRGEDDGLRAARAARVHVIHVRPLGVHAGQHVVLILAAGLEADLVGRQAVRVLVALAAGEARRVGAREQRDDEGGADHRQQLDARLRFGSVRGRALEPGSS